MYGLNFNIAAFTGRGPKESRSSRCARSALRGIFMQEASLFTAVEAVKNTPPVRRGAASDKRTGKASSNYWSSSTNVNNTDNAWIVNFNNGNTNNNNKTNNNYVRCAAGAWTL